MTLNMGSLSSEGYTWYSLPMYKIWLKLQPFQRYDWSPFEVSIFTCYEDKKTILL